jgi:hypothetical protein
VAPARTPRPLPHLRDRAAGHTTPGFAQNSPVSSLPLENQRTSAKKSFDWKVLGYNGLRDSGRRTSTFCARLRVVGGRCWAQKSGPLFHRLDASALRILAAAPEFIAGIQLFVDRNSWRTEAARRRHVRVITIDPRKAFHIIRIRWTALFQKRKESICVSGAGMFSQRTRKTRKSYCTPKNCCGRSRDIVHIGCTRGQG